MKPHACFRISVDELAQDVGNYIELAKTRTFEIYDQGKVEVMLVRIEAVLEWHRQLQTNVPAHLMSDEERGALQAESADLKRWIEKNGDVWPDEID
ncbi:hypothetical protein CD351_00195 [Erythrobacter sp. KY5]|uniref:hypothetical protein n=1 Tax=Erythrobacter sp. KY5 TaxID=2011159 RepID=UPI000DBF33A4|nr:hypothetical protein [Erythrobacter sp. KY5]AWW72840.1 hypothetical protein CD351_00195 [Erythrobacter sp. KY5]